MDLKRCVSNITMFVFKSILCVCVLAHTVCLLPIVPDSVHNHVRRSLPNHQSSPNVSGRETFVQYSLADKPSGQTHLAKHAGAQRIPSMPHSAKQVHSDSINHSPDYANENIVNSTHTRSSPNFNSSKIGKHSKNSRSGGLKTKTAQIPRRNSLPLQYESDTYNAPNSLENINKNVDVQLNVLNDNNSRVGHDMRIENSESLQLAVQSGNSEVDGQTEVSDTMLAVASGVVALFSVGVIIGIFSCCCKKKPQNEEEEKLDMLDRDGNKETEEEDSKANTERSLVDSKKPSQVFNSSGIPEGEKDLDDTISFKDKIKALDNKLIIQPSPDKRKSLLAEQAEKRKSQLTADQPANRLSQHSPDVATKRKSQNEANMVNSITGLPKQPKIVVSEDDDVQSRDKDASRSAGDNISKSDTQDDISDKIFDNLSMHSSTSQPFNPDVVIADSDEEDEFGEIQRGTVILKSFQRAKPPRNRSPATRTSKGKIRKPRPNARNQGDKKEDREPTSTTPSSASVPFSMATSDSKTNSLEKSETKVQNNTSKNNSLEKVNERKKSLENNFESPMSKSSNFSDFDSIMSQSITSVGSDIVTPMKRETAKNGKFAKTKKDSPKRDRKESPARLTKSKEREITEKDKRNDSPSRFKKNKDSPVEKRKNRRKEEDRVNKNRLSSDVSEDKAVTNSSRENRLSGIPATASNNASNNIFFLIDPTVKDKCKSVGDVTRDKRTSGDYSRHAQKAVKHHSEDNPSKNQDEDDSLGAVKRERTLSDPNRKSAELKTNTR